MGASFAQSTTFSLPGLNLAPFLSLGLVYWKFDTSSPSVISGSFENPSLHYGCFSRVVVRLLIFPTLHLRRARSLFLSYRETEIIWIPFFFSFFPIGCRYSTGSESVFQVGVSPSFKLRLRPALPTRPI